MNKLKGKISSKIFIKWFEFLEESVEKEHRLQKNKVFKERILMFDEILKRDKLLLRDKSNEKEFGLQRSKKSLNLG